MNPLAFNKANTSASVNVLLLTFLSALLINTISILDGYGDDVSIVFTNALMATFNP